MALWQPTNRFKDFKVERQQRQNGDGVLFSFQSNHPKGPQFKGEIMLGGTLYKISGWERTTTKGKLISLKEDNWKPTPKPQKTYPVEIDGDVPF